MVKLILAFLCCIAWVDAHRRGPFLQFFPQVPHHNPPQNETGVPLFLTPLITQGKIKQAQNLARVGTPMNELVESYSGYLTVNKPSCNSNLFFWFFPAAYKPEKAPVLLWLQGGPGGSSMFGLFVEHGPFRVTRDMKLEARDTAWSLTHNVLYIDNPVGTGFSFTGRDECYARDQTNVADDLYEALLQFFQLFPQYQKSDFYATGESYAGKYVPAISYKIHTANPSAKQKINFKGMAIGDGLCDPVTMTNYGDFLFAIGLVDEEDRAYFKKVSELQVKLIESKQWVQAFQTFDDLLNGDLSGHPSYFANATGFNYYFNYLMTSSPPEFSYFGKFLQTTDIRKAIHVGNLTYNDGLTVEKHLMEDVMKSVKPWIEELLEHYKVIIYNGQMDVIIAWPLTESFITSMKWKGAEEYLKSARIKWHVGNDLAGYAKQVGNFTQVLVRNAGHMIPYDQPKWAFDLINRFTRGKSFN
uniref:Cathepsin A2 n=1 Tax=Tigriopus japonicus TaxID=158387 RepID=A0A0H4KC28_TIGJA|nr:cathepsin A2 [Tigriopus japonicus]